MTLSDITDMCKMRLRNVAKTLNDKYIYRAIHMGISDLYNRFNLSIKTEVVSTSVGLPMYEVRSTDCQMIVSIYDLHGNELRQSDVLDSKKWQWKQVNYRSFLMSKPDGSDYVVAYKASPVYTDNPDAVIELPEAFIEALFMYVVYMVSATVQSPASATGHRAGNESKEYRDMYEEECSRLIMMGYKININTERPAIQMMGFV